MHTIKRASAILLAFFITAAALITPAASAETTASVSIGTGVQKTPTAQIEAAWDDAWFAEPATDYQHSLAMTAMALSGAAYGEKTGMGDALEKLGFEHVQSYHYDAAAESGADTAAYTFAVRRIDARKGGDIWLTAVVIRGTHEILEWAGNLDLGTGIVHEGFARARDDLTKNLNRYLSALHISSTAESGTKFLVTGHSRGGAVANLTAAYLMDSMKVPREDVYAYTFAAPAVSVRAAEAGYENIFNITNREDLVTRIPLAKWGYARYGTDLTLPGRAGSGERSQDIFRKMEQQYTALTGQPYAVFQDQEAVENTLAAIGRLIPNATGADMSMLAALLSGDLEELSALADQNSLTALLLGGKALALSSELAPLLKQEREAVVSAHCMAGYYSWLSACGTTGEAEAMFAAAGAER